MVIKLIPWLFKMILDTVYYQITAAYRGWKFWMGVSGLKSFGTSCTMAKLAYWCLVHPPFLCRDAPSLLKDSSQVSIRLVLSSIVPQQLIHVGLSSAVFSLDCLYDRISNSRNTPERKRKLCIKFSHRWSWNGFQNPLSTRSWSPT